jgi:hypothetical protein
MKFCRRADARNVPKCSKSPKEQSFSWAFAALS